MARYTRTLHPTEPELYDVRTADNGRLVARVYEIDDGVWRAMATDGNYATWEAAADAGAVSPDPYLSLEQACPACASNDYVFAVRSGCGEAECYACGTVWSFDAEGFPDTPVND